jgi:hypothetical protein
MVQPPRHMHILSHRLASPTGCWHAEQRNRQLLHTYLHVVWYRLGPASPAHEPHGAVHIGAAPGDEGSR